MEVSSNTVREMDRLTDEEGIRIIEAILFVTGRFLSIPELVKLTDLNPAVINEYIEKLKERYKKEGSAIDIIKKNDNYKMDVRREYVKYVNKLATGSSEFTKAEQETLAIIAYKQPIKQSVVVKIRGNKSYNHIKRFLELNLVKKKKLGHTYELSLTDDFYDYFNLESITGG